MYSAVKTKLSTSKSANKGTRSGLGIFPFWSGTDRLSDLRLSDLMVSQTLIRGVNFHAGDSKYTAAAQTARDNMVSQNGHNWTIVDGGLIDANDNPTNIFLSSTTILENEPANTTVGILSTNGGAPSYTYTFTTGSGDTE